MFADDRILFCKAYPPSLRIIMKKVHAFHHCTGLQANLQKSQLVMGGTSYKTQLACLQESGLAQGHFPLTYLGIPITASRLTKIKCASLVEKISARVHTWATRHISYAGMAMLTSSVIFGQFAYWASIFLLPNKVVDKIT